MKNKRKQITELPKKKYKYLYSKMLDKNVIFNAYRKMRKGKTKRVIIKNIDANLDHYIDLVYELLYNTIHDPDRGFCPPRHKRHLINEYGKDREIYIPSTIEQWVHHIIMQVLAPILVKSFYYHSYGNVPNKGLHAGKKIVSKWKHNHKYVAKLDIRHFYPNVRFSLIVGLLEKFILDSWFIYIIKICMRYHSKGMPLGFYFYLSQWMANMVLTPLDIFIMNFNLKHIRYVDDILIFSNSKRKLYIIIFEIKHFLGSMGLKLKSNYQVYKCRTDRISFLGFIFIGTKIRLRKKIVNKLIRVSNMIFKAKEYGKEIWVKNLRRILSLMGWVSCADAYKLYLQKVKPKVCIRDCKRIVSKIDKKEALVYDTLETRGVE